MQERTSVHTKRQRDEIKKEESHRQNTSGSKKSRVVVPAKTTPKVSTGGTKLHLLLHLTLYRAMSQLENHVQQKKSP